MVYLNAFKIDEQTKTAKELPEYRATFNEGYQAVAKPEEKREGFYDLAQNKAFAFWANPADDNL